jgi:hypothetical protein
MPTIVLPCLDRRCMKDGGVVVARLSMLSFPPQDQLPPVIHDALVCEHSQHDGVIEDIDRSSVKFCDQWGLAVVIFAVLVVVIVDSFPPRPSCNPSHQQHIGPPPRRIPPHCRQTPNIVIVIDRRHHGRIYVELLLIGIL